MLKEILELGNCLPALSSLFLPAPSIPYREALKASKYHSSHLNIKLKEEPCRVCSIKINYFLQMQKTIRYGKDISSEHTSTIKPGRRSPNFWLLQNICYFSSAQNYVLYLLSKKTCLFHRHQERTRLEIKQPLITRCKEFARYVFPVDITHLDGSFLALFPCLRQLIPATTLQYLNVEFTLASVGVHECEELSA